MILKNFSIATRLWIGFGVLLLLMLAISVLGIAFLNTAGKISGSLARETLSVERITSQWFTKISINSERTVALAKSEDPEVQAFFQSQIAITNKEIAEIQKKLEPLVLTEEGKKLLKSIATNRKNSSQLGENVFNRKRAGRHASAMKIVDEEFLPAVQVYLASIEALLAYQKSLTIAVATDADTQFQRGQILMASLSSLALALGIALAWTISRSISRPLFAAVGIAERVARGDLSAKIDAQPNDETGKLLQALKRMNDSLSSIIGNVRDGTESIRETSKQITKSNLRLSERTTQQSDSIQETSSAITSITETIEQNAQYARQAHELVTQASEYSAQGEQAFRDVELSMSSIQSGATQISNIIGVIDGIAFQSNILALIAAVEAARAGAQGRGFAVVAGEVRTLSQRSASAAKEIKTLISESMAQVSAGMTSMRHARCSMDQIVSSVTKVSETMEHIKTASYEQNNDVMQIDSLMKKLRLLTRCNVEQVEESAVAGQSLELESNTLTSSVAMFSLVPSQNRPAQTLIH